MWQNHAHFAVGILFVVGHKRYHAFLKSPDGENVFYFLRPMLQITCIRQTRFVRQKRFVVQTVCHRFAVRQFKGQFHGMSDSVSEVENFSFIVVERVLLYNALLEIGATHDCFLQIALPCNGVHFAVQHAVLQNFPVAVFQLLFVQRFQKISVDEGVGDVKGADGVFHSVEVQSRFATNAAVHLRQKRCRNVQQFDATFENAGAKTDSIPYGTATHRHDCVAFLQTVLQKPLAQFFCLRKGFGLFPTWQQKDIALQPVQLSDFLVRYYQTFFEVVFVEFTENYHNGKSEC